MRRVKTYSKFIISLILISITLTAKGQSYCSSSGNMSYNTSVTFVNFNTINNTSAKPSGYSNYKVQSTSLLENSTNIDCITVTKQEAFITFHDLISNIKIFQS